jgi:predicted nucleic acid-binding protein
MGLTLVDSSVVVGFLDPGDPHHEAATSAFSRAGPDDLAVSAITLAEVLVGAIRAGDEPHRLVRGFFADAVARIEPVDEGIAAAAAALRAQGRRLRLPDALVIATGESIAAERIMTADAGWRGISRRVEVI